MTIVTSHGTLITQETGEFCIEFDVTHYNDGRSSNVRIESYYKHGDFDSYHLYRTFDNRTMHFPKNFKELLKGIYYQLEGEVACDYTNFDHDDDEYQDAIDKWRADKDLEQEIFDALTDRESRRRDYGNKRVNTKAKKVG